MDFYRFLSDRLARIFPSDTSVQRRYEAFMALLERDRNAHEVMAELEEIYYSQTPVDFKVLQEKYNTLSQLVSSIIASLSTVCSTSVADLQQFYKMVDGFGRHLFCEKNPDTSPPYVLGLSADDVDLPGLTGGKAATLSKIKKKINADIPRGFAVTTRAFNRFIHSNDLQKPIDDALASLDITSTASLEKTSGHIIEMMQQADIPHQIESAVFEILNRLWPGEDRLLRLAVRSSAVGEDDTISFAGQYRSLINIKKDNVLWAWRRVIESKYAPSALAYRVQCGFLDMETPMGVLVLEMVDPEISGVMYTRTSDTLQNDAVNIHSVYGLGELLVGGKVMPEITYVKRGRQLRVVKRRRSRQSEKMIPIPEGGISIVPVPPEQKAALILDEKKVLSLARTGIELEALFGEPQDIEWCIQENGSLFLLQSRPLQTHFTEETQDVECLFDEVPEPLIASGGETASNGIATGVVKHVRSNKDIRQFPKGAILVSPHAQPDFAQIIDRISAIVTEQGSSAGHFASVAREFGVPFIVGVDNAMKLISDTGVVTVNAIDKTVYKGHVESLIRNPCAKSRPFSESPFMRRLSFLMRFVSPLELTDPEKDNFSPMGCRSFHDIIRYSHESAINCMFQIGGNRWFKTGGIKKLDVTVPVKFNVLDVGGGICESAVDKKKIKPDQILSRPMNAVLKGLLHPDILWGPFSHFNWEEHDRIVMAGGIISPDDAMFASHAIIARNYANLNLKFGYHFVIVDAMINKDTRENQIRFRFSGGGAKMEKRMLRTRFLGRILSWLDFTVKIKHDLIDGIYISSDAQKTCERLDMIGRLLGATRLMDMYLKTDDQMDRFVRDFKNGKYHYTEKI